MDMTTPTHAHAAAVEVGAAAEESRAGGRRRLPILGFRRTLLVNPQFQLRAMALPTILSVATVTALIFALFRVLLASRFDAGDAGSVLETEEARWLLNSLAGSLGFAALMVIIGLLETHRAAGAIFKMQRHIRRVAEGSLGARLHLRRRDHFQDVADDFNRMVENLREEARIEVQHLDQAIDALGQVRPAERDAASARLARAWDALVDIKHRKERALR
jgi:methyl-accepting chemotaxis protein